MKPVTTTASGSITQPAAAGKAVVGDTAPTSASNTPIASSPKYGDSILHPQTPAMALTAYFSGHADQYASDANKLKLLEQYGVAPPPGSSAKHPFGSMNAAQTQEYLANNVTDKMLSGLGISKGSNGEYSVSGNYRAGSEPSAASTASPAASFTTAATPETASGGKTVAALASTSSKVAGMTGVTLGNGDQVYVNSAGSYFDKNGNSLSNATVAGSKAGTPSIYSSTPTKSTTTTTTRSALTTPTASTSKGATSANTPAAAGTRA